MTTTVPMHPGHRITVTPGPMGRAFFDCSCGETQVRASKTQGVRVALAHHHGVGGCNCPPNVVALPEHCAPISEAVEVEPTYWLTSEAYDVLERIEGEQ